MSLTKTVTGTFLILFGGLFTLTILGAVIGIPMISVGLAMMGDSAIGRRRRKKRAGQPDVVVVDGEQRSADSAESAGGESFARRWGRHYARVRDWVF